LIIRICSLLLLIKRKYVEITPENRIYGLGLKSIDKHEQQRYFPGPIEDPLGEDHRMEPRENVQINLHPRVFYGDL